MSINLQFVHVVTSDRIALILTLNKILLCTYSFQSDLCERETRQWCQGGP
jgi:hypothetical protein